jgi:hypothetical protein
MPQLWRNHAAARDVVEAEIQVLFRQAGLTDFEHRRQSMRVLGLIAMNSNDAGDTV